MSGPSLYATGMREELHMMKCTYSLALSPPPVSWTVPPLERHEKVCCSLFSIAAGGSLGPEAPLVAVSASVSGYISMVFFKHDMVMVRKCTIVGMSAGLSAFFGVQLGGEFLPLCCRFGSSFVQGTVPHERNRRELSEGKIVQLVRSLVRRPTHGVLSRRLLLSCHAFLPRFSQRMAHVRGSVERNRSIVQCACSSQVVAGGTSLLARRSQSASSLFFVPCVCPYLACLVGTSMPFVLSGGSYSRCHLLLPKRSLGFRGLVCARGPPHHGDAVLRRCRVRGRGGGSLLSCLPRTAGRKLRGDLELSRRTGELCLRSRPRGGHRGDCGWRRNRVPQVRWYHSSPTTLTTNCGPGFFPRSKGGYGRR